MAHYDLGLYISHQLAEVGHCWMDHDSLIILLFVALIFLFQAQPLPQHSTETFSPNLCKIENTPAKPLGDFGAELYVPMI